MMIDRRNAENGQVLVLLSVGIVILLGFAALAVDGGMVYSDRRYDQNIADNAALVGAGAAADAFFEQEVDIDSFDCDDDAVAEAVDAAESAVQEGASEFNVTVYDNLEAYSNNNNAVFIECHDDGGEDNYLLVKVKLSSQTNTAFAQFIYKGDLINTVESVTRIEPGENDPAGPGADGDGLVGLSEDCDDGTTMLFNGTVNITIMTGGIHSNSCMTKTGTSGSIVTETGSEYITDFSGKESVFCIGTSSSDCVQTDPSLTDSIVSLQIDAPDCASLSEKSYSKKSTTITPGRYTSIIQPNGNLSFAPGLYCLDAGAKFTGSNTISVSGTEENGVTIYLTGGDFAIGGSMTMNLRAPQQGATGSGLAIPGLLLYTSEDYDGTVSMLGNASSFLRGTVFVPNGTLEVGGSSYTSNWSAQMLAKYIKVHGNTTLVLQYDDDDLYWDDGEITQPLLDIYQ